MAGAIVYEVIELPQISRSLCVITFDVPDASVNVITTSMALQFKEALDCAWTYASQQEICAVVFCSAKQKSFIVGADIQYEMQMVDRDSSYRDCRRFQMLLSQIECMPVPTFTILNGSALGGGLELALSCQYRIVDQDTKIQLGLPEVKLGVIPGGGGCCRLPRLISLRKAVEMIVSGATVSPQQAFDIGLVDAVICNTNRENGNKVLDKYPWLTELVALWQAGRLHGGEILKQEDHKHVHLTLADCIVQKSMMTSTDVNRDVSEVRVDELESRMETSLAADRYGGHLLSKTWFEQQIVYAISLQKIRQTACSFYPAPYVALKTIFSCLRASSLSEALKKEADAFSKIVLSVQSKRLMWLFLQSRSLKKKAITAGAQPSLNGLKQKSKVVLIGSDFTTAAIAQGLLYSDVPVQVICNRSEILKVKEAVINLFDYLLTRKKIKYDLVKKKLSRMTFEWSGKSMTEDTRCYVIVCKLGTQQEIQDSLIQTTGQARQRYNQVIISVTW
jgi:enoyl-CoA hydratase/carnithine racemase